jgi:hypothetical protein
MKSVFSTLVLFALAPLIGAQEPSAEAKKQAEAFAPFFDEQTLLVAHVDVSRLPAGTPLMHRLLTILKWDEARSKELEKNVQIWKDEFKKAGGKDVFILAKLSDLRRPLAIVVPVEDTGKDKLLAELFDKLWHDPEVKPQRAGKQLLIGSPVMIEALKNSHPVERTQLAAALNAVGDAPIQAVFLLSKEQRRVIEEMMPKLPKELGGLSSKRITDGVQWLAVSAELEPKLSVKVVIQSSDANSAGGVQGLIGMGTLVLGKMPMADDKPLSDHLGADFARIRKALTPEVQNDRLVLQLNDELLFDFGAKLAVRVQDDAEKKQHINNLKQVVLAMHNYADTHGGLLPGRAGFGTKEAKPVAGKKPLLSWRVFLLPFVEQGQLYQQFHLDEPWDSEHNKKLIASIPGVYQSGNSKLTMEGKTRIVGPVGKDMAFEPSGEGLKMPGDFPDGTSNTIMLVEAAEANAVIWTKPDDLEIDVKAPKKGLFDPDTTSFLAGFADGSVHRIPKRIDDKMLLYMFWRNDGNVIDLPK